jgi:rubrerythrin
MARFESSKTHSFFQEMLAGDAQAYVRMLYFARKADEEGDVDTAACLREIADGELKHALGHLDVLKQVGDPITEMPIDTSSKIVASAIESTSFDCDGLYVRFMSTARDEELFQAAEWIESVVDDKKKYVAMLREIGQGR